LEGVCVGEGVWGNHMGIAGCSVLSCINILNDATLLNRYNQIITIISQEQFEDIKQIWRSCKSKKNRKYNGQKEKVNETNSDLQNTTQKAKD